MSLAKILKSVKKFVKKSSSGQRKRSKSSPNKYVKVKVGNKKVAEHRQVLINDGFNLKGKDTHHRNRRKNENWRGNLVSLTPKQHRAVHLAEDNFDIVTRKKRKPNKYESTIYKNLSKYCKAKPKQRRNR